MMHRNRWNTFQSKFEYKSTPHTNALFYWRQFHRVIIHDYVWARFHLFFVWLCWVRCIEHVQNAICFQLRCINWMSQLRMSCFPSGIPFATRNQKQYKSSNNTTRTGTLDRIKGITNWCHSKSEKKTVAVIQLARFYLLDFIELYASHRPIFFEISLALITFGTVRWLSLPLSLLGEALIAVSNAHFARAF